MGGLCNCGMANVKDRIADDAITRQKEREEADSKVDVPDNLLNPEK